MKIDPRTTDIPPGWPRPYYMKQDDPHSESPARPRRKPVQYITSQADDQIFSCHSGKLEQTEREFACTCCGHHLVRGTLIDTRTLAQLGRWDMDDTNYGGALCYRCTVFAFAVCPEFRKWHTQHGEDFPLLDLKSSRQYYRDPRSGDTGAVHASGTFARKTTLGWVREQVKQGNLCILDTQVEDLSRTNGKRWD